MIVLNVGGGGRHLPEYLAQYEQKLLDIDSSCSPDYCCDTMEVKRLYPGLNGEFDYVYCSHNLEHYYWHDVPKVLDIFKWFLKDNGTVEIRVPNIKNLMQSMNSLDIQDVWYRLGDGTPVTFHDVIYGWNKAMSSGNLFYAHKCGFTPISLFSALEGAGFTNIKVMDQGANLLAQATKG